MNHTIADNFSGAICIGSSEGYNAFFNVNGHVVTLLPLNKECADTIQKLSSLNSKEDTDVNQWLYGFTEDNCNIAILKKSCLSVGLTSGCDMKAAQFYTPLIAKSTACGMNIDLSSFDAIEFYGGIMDILYNPDRVIKWDSDTITFKSSDDYLRKFVVEINDEHFEVTYSISTESLSLELGKLPDLRGTVHSILRFNFQAPRMLKDIEKYYSYAMSLFQFCAGRLNVCSEIRLYKNGVGRPILLRLNDGFDDYADNLNITRVIRLDYLDEFLPGLLKLLNEESTRPHLEFLPRRNKDIHNILYTDVSNLCIAFEIEYSRSKTNEASVSSSAEKDAARKLTNVLIDVIDSHEDCPEIVKSKAKAILNSQLKDFSPSLKEKINYICELYHEDAIYITQQPDHDKLGMTSFYSREEYQKKITDFVKMRNSSSHANITWNDGIDIINHLKLYIYFSVLARTGIPPKSIALILSGMFGPFF